MPLLRATLSVAFGAAWVIALAPPLVAQVPQPDTARAPRDTGRVGPDTATVRVPPRPDSARVDTNAVRAKSDTTRRAKADTLKAPIAESESPVLTDIGQRLRWDRRALFASGALTLADLLERVPGLTTLRARWLTAPMVGAYLGNPTAVRVFLDGMELDVLDARNSGVQDLSTIQLWTLEEVAIERGASEVRVYLRSWRSDRTVPYTRTDASTGDEDTNIYRFFYGKRFSHGEALQLAAQQFSTEAPKFGGDGDALSLLARLGFAKRGWSADAFVNRTRRTRNPLPPISGSDAPPITDLDATDVAAYVRAGYGSPEAGPWLQLVAGHQQFREVSSHVDSAAVTPDHPLDVIDTITSRAQYVASGGYTIGQLRASFTGRYRVFSGQHKFSPSGRLAYDKPRFAASLYAERNAIDERTRLEASARLLPLPFLAISGAVSQTSEGEPQPFSFDSTTGTLVTVRPPKSLAARAEASVRVGGLWLGGGLIARDTAFLTPTTVFARDYAPALDATARGAFASVQGRLYKAIFADAVGVRWNESDTFYRPEYQSRARLYISTEWRRRFPSGNFGFLAGATHEYRSDVLYPVGDGTVRTAPQSRVVSTLVEIRIVSAVISWQFRNIQGLRYQTVPGFEMPRAQNVYGVRWEFWN